MLSRRRLPQVLLRRALGFYESPLRVKALFRTAGDLSLLSELARRCRAAPVGFSRLVTAPSLREPESPAEGRARHQVIQVAFVLIQCPARL